MSLDWDIDKRAQISSNVIRSGLSLSVLQLDAKGEFLVFEVSMATCLVSLKQRGTNYCSSPFPFSRARPRKQRPQLSIINASWVKSEYQKTVRRISHTEFMQEEFLGMIWNLLTIFCPFTAKLLFTREAVKWLALSPLIVYVSSSHKLSHKVRGEGSQHERQLGILWHLEVRALHATW